MLTVRESYEFLAVLLMKIQIFWSVTPCALVNSCIYFEDLDVFFCRAKQKLLDLLDNTFFRNFSKYFTVDFFFLTEAFLLCSNKFV